MIIKIATQSRLYCTLTLALPICIPKSLHFLCLRKGGIFLYYFGYLKNKFKWYNWQLTWLKKQIWRDFLFHSKISNRILPKQCVFCFKDSKHINNWHFFLFSNFRFASTDWIINAQYVLIREQILREFFCVCLEFANKFMCQPCGRNNSHDRLIAG